jgi:hypothetical protein
LFFVAICFLPIFVFGQNLTIEKPYTYTASNDDSRNSARAKAMQEAQSVLLQELGVLVETRQKITTKAYGNNSQQDFVEELKTYTTGKVQTTVVEGTENFADNIFFATFIMVVDTADLYRYLDNILKQKQQARADSIKNVQEFENQRLAKEKKLAELKTAVETARNLLDMEQKQEEPLRKTKDLKYQEFQEAQKQRNSAQTAFENAKKSDDAYLNTGIERIKREGESLQKKKKNYNIKHTEFSVADNNLNRAFQRVEAAKMSLQTAQNNLNKELGIETASEKDLKKTYKVKGEIVEKNKVKTKTKDMTYDVDDKELTVNPTVIARKYQTFNIGFDFGKTIKKITLSWEVLNSEAIVMGTIDGTIWFIGYYNVGHCGRNTCFYLNMEKDMKLYPEYDTPYAIHIDPLNGGKILLHFSQFSKGGGKVEDPEKIEQILPKEPYFQFIKEIEMKLTPQPDKKK